MSERGSARGDWPSGWAKGATGPRLEGVARGHRSRRRGQDGELHVRRLPGAEQPATTTALAREIAARLPQIDLADVLIDIDVRTPHRRITAWIKTLPISAHHAGPYRGGDIPRCCGWA